MQTYLPTRRRSFLPRRFRIRFRPDLSDTSTHLSHIDLQRKAAARTREEPHWSRKDATNMAQKTARRLYGHSRL